MNDVARRVLLRRNPRGMPVAADFEIAEEPMPEPGAGEGLVRTIYVSLDPCMRGGMNRPEAAGKPLGSGMVGQVVASRSGDFAEGQFVSQYVGGSIGGSSHGVAREERFYLHTHPDTIGNSVRRRMEGILSGHHPPLRPPG